MADNKEKEKYEKVTNLIVKSILALSICFFIIYKLWSIEIKIENFDYLYFLSTVIALFAIVLSVLFILNLQNSLISFTIVFLIL